jgi:fermentation-respiration switch protein FrsA (DUF1100 family)
MRSFRSSPAQRRDPYQELTDKIIAALDSGTAPWRRPWDKAAAGGATAPINGARRPSLPGHQPLRPRNVAARFRVQRPTLVQLSPGGHARLAGPQGREGDAGLFPQADRDRGANDRRRTRDAAHPDAAYVLGLSRLSDRWHPDSGTRSRFASPVAYVDEKAPPILLIQGTDDHTVSPAQSPEFYEALRAKGAKVELMMLPGIDHS